MGLLNLFDSTDPSFWLAKIVAAQDRTNYLRDDIRKSVAAIASFEQVALQSAEGVYDSVSSGLLDSLDSFLGSLVGVSVPAEDTDFVAQLASRMSVFNQKYSSLINSTQGQDIVPAPDFKKDSIDVLTDSMALVFRIQDYSARNAFAFKVADVAAVLWQTMVSVANKIADIASFAIDLVPLVLVGIGGLVLYKSGVIQ